MPSPNKPYSIQPEFIDGAEISMVYRISKSELPADFGRNFAWRKTG